MRLHLVGGFLGSGKTTAIIQAARAGMARGQVVGVITNDQGKYLVDTTFFRLAQVPAVEVTGGCFCCNYNDLDENLTRLIEAARPDAIFAESVGSCADIVATVVKPLRTLKATSQQPTSFSVFADARLLRRWLSGLEMPFNDDIVYIFDKQIEEAGLLVINKIDLLSTAEIETLQALVQTHYPQKIAIFQSSLTASGIQPWLDSLDATSLALPEAALEIDYQRYGRGEAMLAWLDASVQVNLAGRQNQNAISAFISAFRRAIDQQNAAVGHLKFMIESPSGSAKISLPTLVEPGWETLIPEIKGGTVILSVNARVEMDADALSRLFTEVLQASGLQYEVNSTAAFHPSPPTPTHRASGINTP